MTDLVGYIAGSGSVATPRTTASAPSKTESASGFSDALNVASTPTTTTQTDVTTPTSRSASSLAPQVRNDPVAGLILEYYDPMGSIVSQVPSSLALTYLRAGLTADGMKHRNSAVGGEASGSTGAALLA